MRQARLSVCLRVPPWLVFLGLLVAMPGPAQAPSPRQVWGFQPGADYKLADYRMVEDYFRKLAAAIPGRVKLVDMGKTAEGQSEILAIISSPENLRKLDRYRAISARLAHARGLTEEQARALAAEGRAVVWIDGGLHATEVAPGQHAAELAYRIATGESPEIRFIRDQVILLEVPSMNPDGLNRVAAWYGKNVGTPYETADMPWLYHKYAGHDDNRDWYMMTQPETRHAARLLYKEWFPQIVYDHHQSGSFSPRIVIPPYDDPMNPRIPPLVMRGVETVGAAIAARLAAENKPGAVSRVGYDTWWNGGMRTTPYFHNMVGILTETALYRYATPKLYKPEDLPKTLPNGLSAAEPTTLNPNPWKGGWWHLRDAVEYEMSGSMAVLDIAARLREQWLMDMWRMGREAIDAGERGAPYAFVVPSEQWDPGASVAMLQALDEGGVEIERARHEFMAEGQRYAAGTYVIRAGQPFRAYVLDLLEQQKYPDLRTAPNGPPKRPYDMTGWTLPWQMGVKVKRIAQKFAADLEPADWPKIAPAAEPKPGAPAYALSHRDNSFARACNRLLKAGVAVSFAAAQFNDGGGEFEPGTIVAPGGAAALGVLSGVARELGVGAVPLGALPASGMRRLSPPRVALYQSWVANLDEGWTRWLLEQYEFPYATIHDADMRAGHLRARFDAIVLPSQEYRSILHGHQPGERAGSSRSVPEGAREFTVERPEYTGGITLSGADHLKEFVEAGGTLIALDAAASLPIQLFGIPVRSVLAGLRPEEFYAPGSLLHVDVDTQQPLAWGMKKDAIAFFVSSQAFELNEGSTAKSVANYARKDVLASGWLLGERHIAGRSAMVDVPMGKGRVILIGFRSQFRGQPHNTFKLLFNSLYSAALQP